MLLIFFVRSLIYFIRLHRKVNHPSGIIIFVLFLFIHIYFVLCRFFSIKKAYCLDSSLIVFNFSSMCLCTFLLILLSYSSGLIYFFNNLSFLHDYYVLIIGSAYPKKKTFFLLLVNYLCSLYSLVMIKTQQLRDYF